MLFKIEVQLPCGREDVEIIETQEMGTFDSVTFVESLQSIAALMGGDVIGASVVNEDDEVLSVII